MPPARVRVRTFMMKQAMTICKQPHTTISAPDTRLIHVYACERVTPNAITRCANRAMQMRAWSHGIVTNSKPISTSTTPRPSQDRRNANCSSTRCTMGVRTSARNAKMV